MKLGAEAFRRALATPATAPRAVLLFGEDSAGIVELREAAVAALGGPQAEADMRVTRLPAQEARANPGAIGDALAQIGFFPGPRIVVVADATDGLAAPLAEAAAAIAPGEAFLIATAGILPARSALRRRFEAESVLAAVTCHTAPADVGEIVARLRALGVAEVEPVAAEALARLSGEIDRLSLRQLLLKLAIHKGAEPGPLTAAHVADCAPPGEGAEIDDLGIAVLARDADAVRDRLARLRAAGTGGVTVAIMLGRLMRTVHAARLAMDDDRMPADAALGRAQPPLRLPTRKAVSAHLGRWSRPEIERAVVAIHGLDASLRSAGAVPEAALVERTLLRLALGARS